MSYHRSGGIADAHRGGTTGKIASAGGAEMTAIAMTVGGERVAGTSSFDVIDPATGEVFDRAPRCEPGVLDAAFAAARTAAGAWAADEDGRASWLRSRRGTIRSC
jgi:hypothetical protein